MRGQWVAAALLAAALGAPGTATSQRAGAATTQRAGADPALVETGRSLATAGDCAGCHGSSLAGSDPVADAAHVGAVSRRRHGRWLVGAQHHAWRGRHRRLERRAAGDVPPDGPHRRRRGGRGDGHRRLAQLEQAAARGHRRHRRLPARRTARRLRTWGLGRAAAHRVRAGRGKGRRGPRRARPGGGVGLAAMLAHDALDGGVLYQAACAS